MSKLKVFMIMPFQDVFMALYNRLKEIYKEDFVFGHAADFDIPRGQQSILKDIVSGIEKSDVVIADLSGMNPNVMYELGIAHTLGKK